MAEHNSSNWVSALTLSLLGVLFIALKLTHVIAWSWLWVLAPFWAVPVGAAISLIVVWIIVEFDKR